MKSIVLYGVFIVCALSMAAAAADITIKSTIDSKGMVGLMNMAGTQQVMISGEKEKEMSSLRMTNKVAKFLGAGKPQDKVEIIRVDKELFWNIEPKDKEYSEMTFAEMKANMEKSLAEAQKEKAENLKKHPEDSVQYRMDVKAEKTGKSQEIAGHKTDETVVTVSVYGKDKESGQQGTFKIEFDLWLAKDVPGMEAYKDFYKAFAGKFGFFGESQRSLDQSLLSFGIDPKEVYTKMGDMEGMPLMTVVTTMAAGMETALGAQKSDSAATAQEKPVSEDEGKPSATKALKGLFGKKKKDENKAESNESKAGEKPYLFKFTSTVTDISVSLISADEFEIPAGFSKKK